MLAKLVDEYPAIKKQFIYSTLEEKNFNITKKDLLQEEKHSPVHGLVHRYQNRVLILVTMQCAAYCRFCTRRNIFQKNRKQELTDKEINNIIKYIKKDKKIKEVLLSGGDALINPKLLKKILVSIIKLKQIRIIRIATRLPIVKPQAINNKILNILKTIRQQAVYIMLHAEHPAEINKYSIKAIKKLQSVSNMVLSQSVFLKGVNDSEKILSALFSRLIEIGVKPYYLFHCDAVQGAGHFIVSKKKEKTIYNNLKKKLSGLAVPHYVIDTPSGKKIQ